MKLKSRIIHAGTDRDPFTGASSIPIYLASTFDQREAISSAGYDYTRSGNPTREALETVIADLEGGARGLAFASGMAATSSALLLFQPGDHLIVSTDVYGGTFRALTTLFARWGLHASFVDSTNSEAVEKALTPKTKGIFVESPSNPLLKITDLAFIANFAKAHGLISLIDNTFCTPYLQRPIEHGFDIVIHSATKFLNGHSDVLAGLIVAREKSLGDELATIQNVFGAVLGVQDCWLLLRGIKTLSVRMDASQTSADALAHKLALHPQIKSVFYPGLTTHPGHAIHARQASGGGSVLSFELTSAALTEKLLKNVKLPLVSVSLGGVESILSHPTTMSHAAMPEKERLLRGISPSLVRLSVGIEDVDDLWDDLQHALSV